MYLQAFLRSCAVFLGLLCWAGLARTQAADPVQISEFMAANEVTLPDEDGDFPDWIEIHNGGASPVDLNGWFLTDKVTNLREWRFPATNLPPNGYLVVFASGKDRAVPGAPLHTNFKLSNDGEYLALVHPDGLTVASSFAPAYPVQAPGISYGRPLQQIATTLVPVGAPARVLVPLDGNLGTDWTKLGFDDTTWTPAVTGVGYETDGRVPFVSMTLGDSVSDFSGTQGQSNWLYGYWDIGRDADGLYASTDFVPFPNAAGPYGPSNYWNGTGWRWFSGDPPFTQLNAQGGQPSADETGHQPRQWAIRRFVSPQDGVVKVSGRLTHTSDWVRVVVTEVAPSAFNPLIYVYMLGLGDGYVDDLSLVPGVVPEGGPNLLVNGNFEAATLSPWTVSPNLAGSSPSTTIRHGGAGSLHVVSTGAGSTQTNAIWQSIGGLMSGQVYTLSYWYLPATNSANLVVRLSGGWLTTTPEYCGGGVLARILVDGAEVFQRPAFVSSSDYSIAVPVQAGSSLDFVLDPGPSGRNSCNAALFTGRVETTDPSLVVVADSVADWSVTGRQGENNWFYGYFNAGSNAVVATYRATNFTAFPRAPGPHSASNYWDGSSWKWWNGDPPNDEIGQLEMVPNGLIGVNSGAQHWVIRRWVSDVTGTLTVDWTLDKFDSCGFASCGGVTARLLFNGILRDSVTVPGTNTALTRRSTVINGARIGDVLDLALDPMGVGNSFGDTGDRSRLSAVIKGSVRLTPQITTDLESSLWQVGSSAYLRIPFLLDEPTEIQFLTLRMKYDDGFVAYLNGERVASANAPDSPAWNATALAPRSDANASGFESFDLTAMRDLLRPGTNVLAIHGLNVSADDSDFLLAPELVGSAVGLETEEARYLPVPTPGAENGFGTVSLGPIVSQVSHAPVVPTNGQDFVVTARVTPTLRPIGSVQLIYRVMYSNEVTVAMFDDGAHGDGVPGDGVYGAVVPVRAGPGQMLRYYVFASDTSGAGMRYPAFSDPLDSAEYLGTVVRDPSLTNSLPVMHLFVRNPALSTNFTGTRCSVSYQDEFFDNVRVSLHGQTTAFIFAKRSRNIELNHGDNLHWSPEARPINAFNLLTPIADKAYVRQILAYETFRQAGVPTHFAFAVRVQLNGALDGIYHFVEKGDDRFLDRVGLDDRGALYKVYQPLTNAFSQSVEKKTRQNEPNTDLQAFIEALIRPPVAVRPYLFDNVDIPEVINFLATLQLVQDEDCCWGKNYYLYRDSEGTGEWQMMPWDLDLTFGRTFDFFYVGGQLLNGYFNTNIFWTNRWYSETRSQLDFIGVSKNVPHSQPLADALLNTPATLEMFLRRWSTLQERFLQNTNTHPLLKYYERRMDELAAQLAADAELDFAKWGNWNPVQTMPVALDVLKTEYFARRRGWIFNTLRYANDGPYLGPQPTNAVLRFGAIEFNPASGNQAQEYIEVLNPNAVALDLSGWKVSGAVDFTFKPGTVMPSNSALYLSPDVSAFRARGVGPRGGLGLFVQGNYHRQLSAWGEELRLADDTGRLVYATNYTGNPSPAQQALRITEIMYHPRPGPPGLATNAEDYEYIELRNIGGATLNLDGVRLTAGIEFNFSDGAISSLAPGQTLLVVKNLAAFLSRYGPGHLVAGEYAGSLDNNGENLRLEDASGEKILDFTYRDDWYRITAGAGFSLVVQDDEAPWQAWDTKEQWRPSDGELGSPGDPDPQPPFTPGILVNEVLTRTDPPDVDAVELYNPTPTPVNLKGWFLSDDFGQPRKFRIAGDVLIPAGGYLLFDEHDFNADPTAPGSFAFRSSGDEVYLFSGDANTNLTGYVHGFSFGAAETGMSFGRYRISTGEEHFVAQTAYTPRASNAGPRVGPVVISEIQFHPPDLPNGADDVSGEYIELRNATDTAVSLFDPARPLNTWQVTGAVTFNFPTNTMLAAREALLLVSFDPRDATALRTFRDRYGVSPAVRLLGPYQGKLDNSGEKIALSRPGVPELGVVPSILVERVDYRDGAPWPDTADGTGASLQRRNLLAYGNDPINWMAAAPRAGADPAGMAAPTIVLQPASQIGVLYQPVAFNVVAAGVPPLRYQWRYNGANLLAATNAWLQLPEVRFEQAGDYSVTVFNRGGNVTSSNASLRVGVPPYFTSAPQNVRLRGSTNDADYGFTTNSATFEVQVAASGTARYQWRFQGTNLPGATASRLTVPSVDLARDGFYDVVVTDDIGSVPSPAARLTVLVSPTLVEGPLTQAVASNSAFTASVVIRGNPPPFHYRWFEASVYRGGDSSDQRTNVFTYGPISNLAARAWRVIVTNEANLAGSANAIFFVAALPDADGDGLPDEWEEAFGFAPGDARDRDLDADGDGLSNWQEYVAGTNPRDPQSFLRIDRVVAAPGGAGAMVAFGARAYQAYSLQYSDSLAGTNWIRLADVPMRTTNIVRTLFDPTYRSNRFYRVVTPPQP